MLRPVTSIVVLNNQSMRRFSLSLSLNHRHNNKIVMNKMLFSTNNNKIQLTPEEIEKEIAKVEKYKLFIRQPGEYIYFYMI